MTEIPRDHQASLLPWLQQAAVGIEVIPVDAPDIAFTWWHVVVHNGEGGHNAAGTVLARCPSEQEATLVAVALWALLDRHALSEEPDAVVVNGGVVPVADIDNGAHATLHDPHATERERGMATTIMALVDARRGESGIRPGADYVRCSRCGKRVSNVLPVEVVVRAFVECPECIEAKAAQEQPDE